MSPLSTRDKLIQAMSRSMQTRGFEATGMKDVLESAAVSTGSLYHAFPGGKEELGAAAVREVGLAAAERIRAVLAESSSVAEALERLVEVHHVAEAALHLALLLQQRSASY